MNITNEAPDWWVTVLTGALPALAALVVVFLNGIVQRRVQQRSFDDADQRWTEQQRAERVRWEVEHNREHERFLRSERLGAYAKFLAALDEEMEAGITTAEWAAAPERHQPSLERLNELLASLGETAGGRSGLGSPEVERWRNARVSARRTGLQAALLASDDHRGTFVEALQLPVPSPITSPEEWLWRKGDPDSGPALTALVNVRNRVEQIARREIVGGTGQDRRVDGPVVTPCVPVWDGR